VVPFCFTETNQDKIVVQTNHAVSELLAFTDPQIKRDNAIMGIERTPGDGDPEIIDEPQPTDETVQVEAGTSSAVHQQEMDDLEADEVSPENQPLEERDA
jgi:hypothetical protein